MIKKSKNINGVKKKESTLSKKLEQLENVRAALVSTTFTMSDLIDDLTGYSKQNGKRD